MSVRFDEQVLRWGLGILQPATPDDVAHFLNAAFPDTGNLPSATDVHLVLERWVEAEQVVRVHTRLKLYSLTARGNHLMPVALRRNRDKVRLFLLKDAHAAKVWQSGEGPERLAGGPPAVSSSSSAQGARPINPAAISLRGALSALNDGRTYWPRVVKQLTKVGSDWPTPDAFFHFYSFFSERSLKAASDRPANDGDLSITDLGLAIGVSPRLLTSFIHSPKAHYRQFKIGKRGGGERVINAPRIFLKTIQYWLIDYFLWALPLHPCSHAYQIGRSIVTNATAHVGKKYVANVDIKDFFPSIRPDAVAAMLEGHGFGTQLASAIARLGSLNNGLPQGAPTSPALSNAYMFDIDDAMDLFCQRLNVTYTRYGDDITFSGNNRRHTSAAMRELRSRLAGKRLHLNRSKTRVASVASQQKVTGVVVNEKAQPPRVFLRRVRAMLHQAENNPAAALSDLARLRGYVSYLNSFPALQGSPALRRYRTVLGQLPK